MRLIKAILAGLFFAFSVHQADATILFAGGEDVDGSLVGTVTMTTTSTQFRAGYARAAIQPAGNDSADPPSNRIVIPSFANQTIIWVHAESISSVANTGSNYQAIGVFGSDGNRRLIVRGTGSNSTEKISTRNTAGTFVDLVTCTNSWPSTSLNKLDLFVNYAVSGEVTLYVNGVQLCDYTGDITTNSITAVNDVDFGNPTSAGPNAFSWSEFIVSTTDTRSMNLLTCAPASNGTNMAWSGSFSNVNPTTINDASVISSSTNNQVAEFNGPALPSGSFTVPAVTQTVRLVLGASGPQHFRYIARPSSGSTDYDNGSDVNATTSFANYQNVWATNPAGGAWTTGDLSTCGQFGVKSISMLLSPDDVVPFVLPPRLPHLLRLAA